jgi:hypothetical protein
VSVYCSGRDAAFLPPNLGQKFGTGKHAAEFTSKQPEERKLLRGQSDSMGADAHAMFVTIQTDAAEQGTTGSGGNSNANWNRRGLRWTPPAYLGQRAGDSLEIDGS